VQRLSTNRTRPGTPSNLAQPLGRGMPLTSRLRLCAGKHQGDPSIRRQHLDKAREVFASAIYHRPRIRLTIRQWTRVLSQWPQ
jgi:hypothetical protein